MENERKVLSSFGSISCALVPNFITSYSQEHQESDCKKQSKGVSFLLAKLKPDVQNFGGNTKEMWLAKNMCQMTCNAVKG